MRAPAKMRVRVHDLRASLAHAATCSERTGSARTFAVLAQHRLRDKDMGDKSSSSGCDGGRMCTKIMWSPVCVCVLCVFLFVRAETGYTAFERAAAAAAAARDGVDLA